MLTDENEGASLKTAHGIILSPRLISHTPSGGARDYNGTELYLEYTEQTVTSTLRSMFMSNACVPQPD